MTQESQKDTTSLMQVALDILRQATSGNPFSSRAELARATGESEANLSRWLSGAAKPSLRKLEPILMALGVRFTLPGDAPTAQEPALSNAWPNGWSLLHRGEELPQLISLQIPSGDYSMQPTLAPGDMVTVDTTLRYPLKEGQLYLVRPGRESKDYLFRRLSVQKQGSRKLAVLMPDDLAGKHKVLIYRMPASASDAKKFIVGMVVRSVHTYYPRKRKTQTARQAQATGSADDA